MLYFLSDSLSYSLSLLLLICLSVCVCVSDADTITRILQDYHERISSLEDVKFDLEYAVKKKDYEVELCYILFLFFFFG